MVLKHVKWLALNITFMTFIYSLPQPQSSPLHAHKIKIKNNISKKDAYKTKLFMRHYPEEFVVKVNGKELKTDDETEIVIPDKKFSVQYSYIWNAPWGKITGTKEVNYELTDPNQKTIELNFSSWDDEYRIKASGTQPMSVKVIESSGNRKKPKKKHADNTVFNKSLLSVSPAPLNNQPAHINVRKICAN